MLSAHHLKAISTRTTSRKSFQLISACAPISYILRWAHNDPAYADFAFGWCVGRRLSDPSPQRTTRSQKRKVSEVSINPVPDGGSSYVDATLGVVVRQAIGTLTAFRSDYIHGTTRAAGAHSEGVGITFSKRLAEMYKDLEENVVRTEVFDYAGEGSDILKEI